MTYTDKLLRTPNWQEELTKKSREIKEARLAARRKLKEKAAA